MRIILFTVFIVGSIYARCQEFSIKEKSVLEGYPAYIMEAAYSPFNQYFALTVGNNTIEVYDANDQIIFQHQGNPRAVGGHFDFSSDEKYLYMGKFRELGDVGVLRLKDQKLMQVISDHSSYVNDVAAHPSAHIFATASSDNTLNVYMEKDGSFEKINHFEDEKTFSSIDFSSTGEYLVACGQSRKVFVYKWNKSGYELYQTIPVGKTYLEAVSYHPVKDEFICGYYGFKKWQLRGKSFELTDSVNMKGGSLRDLNFSPAGDYMVACKYNDVLIYKVSETGFELIQTLYRHQSSVFSSSFTSDGKMLVTASHDRTAIKWELTGVSASDRAKVVGYLNGNITTAGKRILTTPLAREIVSNLDKNLQKPKGEFETSKDYYARKEKLKLAALQQMQEAIERKYTTNGKVSKGNIVKLKIDRLIKYDADAQKYELQVLGEKTTVQIKPAEAKELKEKLDKAYIQAEKKLNDGETKYDNFELVHPSGNTYKVKINVNPFEPEIAYKGSDADAEEMEPTTAKLQSSGNGKTYALLIATGEYDHFDNLVNPVIDAKTLQKELENTYGCIVELKENPTLNELVKSIKSFASRKYNPQDQLFIFIAGHGYYDEVFKEGYVIAKDSKSNDVAHTSFLSHSNLRTMVNNIPCEHIFLCMDVCFAGTFDPVIASTNRATDLYEEVDKQAFISRKLQYKTRMYLTSGGKEYVPDGRPGQHSPFTRKLLEALRNYGGKDGILTLNEIVSYIEKVIPQPRFGEFGDNEPGSDFLFIKK